MSKDEEDYAAQLQKLREETGLNFSDPPSEEDAKEIMAFCMHSPENNVPLPIDVTEQPIKAILLDLLSDAFADEIEHLKLRQIRDAQAPRFEELKESHPEIYRDFMEAREGPHEVLLKNRRRRVEVLTGLVEGRSPGKRNYLEEPDEMLQEATRLAKIRWDKRMKDNR